MFYRFLLIATILTGSLSAGNYEKEKAERDALFAKVELAVAKWTAKAESLNARIDTQIADSEALVAESEALIAHRK